MRRILFTSLAAVSLALCLFTVFVWVLGEFHIYGYGLDLGDRTLQMSSGRGTLRFNLLKNGPNSKWQTGIFDYGAPTLSYASYEYRVEATETTVFVTHWTVATVLALTPLVWFILVWRRKRGTKSGRCPVCGYDLRGTPDRCPECGAVPQAKPQAAA
jgi:hypothetical protein